jgi:hypothetical protein
MTDPRLPTNTDIHNPRGLRWWLVRKLTGGEIYAFGMEEMPNHVRIRLGHAGYSNSAEPWVKETYDEFTARRHRLHD